MNISSSQLIYVLSSILVMAAATQITRALPFIIFSRRSAPDWLIRGAKLIPGAVMLVLVFTSLPFPGDGSQVQLWIPWLSVAVVAALHLLFRHPLLSIIGGTALYMALIHFF